MECPEWGAASPASALNRFRTKDPGLPGRVSHGSEAARVNPAVRLLHDLPGIDGAAEAEDGVGRAARARELKRVSYAGNVRIANSGIPGTAVSAKDPVTPR